MADMTTVNSGDAPGRRPAAPTLVSLIDTMVGREAVDPELARRLNSVREYLVASDDADRPFLTVLLRTQGKRIEPFKDALLSLAAQTDQDFNVVVLEHNATPENALLVREVLARQPAEFAARIQLIEVLGGLRAKPLNEGIRVARGHYVAVYDDDDLVFANWVESFHTASRSSDGRLLRGVVANQKVTPEVWPQGHEGFRTTTWPAAEYPAEFDQLQHLVVNYSPFMSWAFPSALFNVYGLRFDEELTVCEDWDMILRGSLLCGVESVQVLTAIYRRWEDGESSYTSHSTESWKASEQRVIDRIDDNVIMMPPGSMEQLRWMVLFNHALFHYRFLFKGNQLRQPFELGWRAMLPFVKVAVRVRNKARRMRAK
jgi:hypothetical protein